MARRWSFEQLEDRMLLSAAVWTDRPDYIPGSTAIINGSGFGALEAVSVKVEHSNDGYTDGPYIWQASTQVDGSFQTQWTVVNAINSSYLLTATGQTSRLTAQTTFTDSAGKIGSVSVAAQNGTLTYGTAGSATFSITVNRGPGPGAFDANLMINATLPSGATFSFSPTPVHFTSSANSAASTLTISTLSSTPAGNTSFTVTATNTLNSADSATSSPSSTLKVNKAPLTITADSKTKVYGAALPTLTATYTGFVNGDTAASLTTQPTLTTTATASSHVVSGGYPITASGAASSNYTFSYVSGTLTVSPAPLTITADSKTKAYGAPLPGLTASYSGFVNGDTSASLTTQPTLSTTATAASHVAGGPYSITASGALDTDYTISYVGGTLTVTPAPLTITADGKTKVYGAALPALTVSYSGLVNGDTPSSFSSAPTLSTTATAASNVGPYDITASGAADTDYSIGYVKGTLTVTAASAQTTYTGATFASTGSSTNSTATVTLSATIQDLASGIGDIRNARVTFQANGVTLAGCSNLPVGLVNPADIKTGTATCNYTFNIGNANSQDYTITIIINGDYTANVTDGPVTVSKVLSNFITGGGYIVESNSAGQ